MMEEDVNGQVNGGGGTAIDPLSEVSWHAGGYDGDNEEVCGIGLC